MSPSALHVSVFWLRQAQSDGAGNLAKALRRVRELRRTWVGATLYARTPARHWRAERKPHPRWLRHAQMSDFVHLVRYLYASIGWRLIAWLGLVGAASLLEGISISLILPILAGSATTTDSNALPDAHEGRGPRRVAIQPLGGRNRHGRALLRPNRLPSSSRRWSPEGSPARSSPA